MGSTRRGRKASKSPARSPARSASRGRGKKKEKKNKAASPAQVSQESSSTPGKTKKKVVLAIDENKDKRKRSWKRRVFYSWVLFWSFLLQMTTLKQLGCVLCVFATATMCYTELLGIMHEADKESEMPSFHGFYAFWFLLFAGYFYGHQLEEHLLRQSFEHVVGFKMSTVAKHFRAIFFVAYSLGLVAFVLSLRKKHLYKYQFERFGYCHIILLGIVAQSSAMLYMIFEGIIWWVLPSSLVVTNDVFAYIFGFMYGRTPLIPKLSPKKTVEGFIGGLFMTMVFSMLISRIFSWFPLMVCPQEGVMISLSPFVEPCKEMESSLFQPFPIREYIPQPESYGLVAGIVLKAVHTVVPDFVLNLTVQPLQLHSVVIGLFASLIAPFGGFFASGFKRAYHKKDFGTLIPGHGGVMDRVDCQLVMGLFAYIYYTTWVNLTAAAFLSVSLPFWVSFTHSFFSLSLSLCLSLSLSPNLCSP